MAFKAVEIRIAMAATLAPGAILTEYDKVIGRKKIG